MNRIILEAPVFTLEAALLGAKYGVDRLELCADFGEGGTTPSAGMLAFIKKQIDIPVFVMIRPRGGDFVYSEEELEVMKQDIYMLQELGADGFVFGVLKADGRVNQEACLGLKEITGDLPCTFHRAIDVSLNLEESLEAIINCGFDRVLTSGGRDSVTDGMGVIKNLMKIAGKRIIIMPGGGTKPSHLNELSETGYLKEVHSSCKAYRPSLSDFANPQLNLSEAEEKNNQVLTVDAGLIDEFRTEIGRLSR